MNEDLSDIATGLTGSLARDGQGGMTAVLPLDPSGIDYTNDPNTGFYRPSADTQAIKCGGVDVLTADATTIDIVDDLNITGDVAITGDLSVTGAFSVSATGWVVNGDIAEAAVDYKNIQKPSTTSLLLGTPSIAQQTITNAANNGSGLIRLTVADTTGYVTNDVKTVAGIVGTTEANSTWPITVIDATTIDLQGSTFTNAYVSGGTIGGFVEEITLGSSLSMTKNVLSVTSTSFAPTSAFTKLSIKVATNTTVAVVASFVSVSNGTLYQTLPFSGTINLGTTGANALDAGTIAANSSYAVWAIAKADGTAALLASLSFTAPTLPSGYTFKARIGAVRTAVGSAQLYGTWQFGRQARYVVGLAQTTALPNIANGSAGTFSPTAPTWAAVSISSFVPSTASEISIVATGTWNNSTNQNVEVAPNNSYAGPDSTNPPPFCLNVGITNSNTFSMLLESTNIYWASSGTGGAISCYGWEDNL